MRYQLNKSIAQQGGLRPYLEATRSKHGGNGYDDFVLLIDLATQQKLAEKFQVDWTTIHRWKRIYEKEKEK